MKHKVFRKPPKLLAGHHIPLQCMVAPVTNFTIPETKIFPEQLRRV